MYTVPNRLICFEADVASHSPAFFVRVLPFHLKWCQNVTAVPFKVEQENSNKKLANEKRLQLRNFF